MIEPAALVQKLDDVEAELRLDHLGNLAGAHLLQRRAECGVELFERRGVHLAAAHHRAGVLRIHAGEVFELGLARDHAFAHVDQPFARTLLGSGHRLGKLGDLRIDILVGDERQAVLRDRLVETLHLARNHRHLVDHLGLHGVGIGLLLVTLAHDLADVEDRHVVLGFELGDRAFGLDHLLHLLLDARHDVGVVDLHRVDLGLVVEQLLGHQRFERLVHRVAVGSVTLLTALFRQLARIVVHLGVEDRRSAHHGHHLVEHHLSFLRKGACEQQGERRGHHSFFQHLGFVYRFIFIRLSSVYRRRKSSPRPSPRPGRKAPPRARG